MTKSSDIYFIFHEADEKEQNKVLYNVEKFLNCEFRQKMTFQLKKVPIGIYN